MAKKPTKTESKGVPIAERWATDDFSKSQVYGSLEEYYAAQKKKGGNK